MQGFLPGNQQQKIRHMNFMNIIINNGNVEDEDRTLLFPNNEIVNIIALDNPRLRDMLDVLVLMSCFTSRTQARKNWKGPIDFPPGWNEFWVGKLRRHLCMWNPTLNSSNYQ